METKTVYFEDPGPANTAEALRLAKERADALGIRSVVVASYSGKTGVEASSLFRDFDLTVVAGVVGFREPNLHPMQEDAREAIEQNGGRVLFGGHAFGMLGRAVHRKFDSIQVDEIIANVLRLFGSGVKVACEISCMAADAGMVKSGEEIVAVAGTGRGADTALVLRATNTHTFFDLRILEIVCKPR
jgi:hypothetical protein